MQVKVRIFVPKDPSEKNGHYDLQIMDKVTFQGITLDNPIFSYEYNSHLYFFPEANTQIHYFSNNDEEDEYTIYKWAFEVSGTAQDIQNKMESQVNEKISDTEYSVKGDFSEYTLNTYNCFYATAIWMNWLNNYELLVIRDVAHETPYLDYSPKRMLKEYGNNWSKV